MQTIERDLLAEQAHTDQQPTQVAWPRRRFLKSIGACTATAVAVDLLNPTINFLGMPLAVWEAAGPGTHQVQSQALAATAQLLQQALGELQQHGFPFDLNQYSLIRMPGRPDLVGLLLHDTRIPPYQTGADIACTINLKAPQHSTLQYVIGHSYGERLEIQSTFLNIQGQRAQAQLAFLRTDDQRRSTAIFSNSPGDPAGRAHHHHGHSAAVAVAPAAIWQESSLWYYDRCGTIGWYVSAEPGEASIAQLRYDSASEYRRCRDCAHQSTITYGGWYAETRSVVWD